jgi:VanZ family protein
MYGLLIEALQSTVSYRTAESGDLLADGIGIAAGIAIALLATGSWSLPAENWLKNRFG